MSENSHEDDILNQMLDKVQDVIFKNFKKMKITTPKEQSLFMLNIIAHLAAGTIYQVTNQINRKEILALINKQIYAILEKFDKEDE